MDTETISQHNGITRPSRAQRNVWRINSEPNRKFQSLRVSKLDLNSIRTPLERFYNETLLNIILSYDPMFDAEREIEENEITDILLKEVAKLFDCSVDDIAMHRFEQDFISIERKFGFNIYDITFADYKKLRYENEKLYAFVCKFFMDLDIPCVELDETYAFHKEMTEWGYDEDDDREEILNPYTKHTVKMDSEYAEIKSYSDKVVNFVKELTAYNPRRKEYKALKAFMLKWYGNLEFIREIISCERLYNYYNEKDDENEDYIALENCVFKSFTDANSPIRSQFINTSLQDWFSNQYPIEPQDFIHADKNLSSEIGTNVKLWDEFSQEFFEVKELFN